jgi:hypothetical protein
MDMLAVLEVTAATDDDGFFFPATPESSVSDSDSLVSVSSPEELPEDDSSLLVSPFEVEDGGQQTISPFIKSNVSKSENSQTTDKFVAHQ